MEAQERDEQSVGRATKLVKGKVGKPKVKKIHLEETLPSPYGRRVEPPSQPMKADTAKKLTKRKKVRGSRAGADCGPPTVIVMYHYKIV